MTPPGNDISSTPPSGPPACNSAGTGTKLLNKHGLIILAVASCLMFLVGLNNIALWDPDQPKYAEVTRNMIESGDYLLLRYHNENYPNKPPLHFWMMAGFSRFTGGVDETAARLPSALAGVGVVLVTFILGRRLFGARIAFITGGVLLTTSYFVEHTRVVRMDMPLILFMTLMLAIFYIAHEKRKADWWVWPAFFLLGALGTGMKGPVGLILPLIICLAFSLLTRNWRAWNWSIAAGAVLYLVVVGAWLLPLWRHAGGEYMYNILIQQNIGRALGQIQGLGEQPRPFYFHLVGFPRLFLQWTPLFLLACAMAVLRFRRGERDARIWFVAAWFVVTLVFFTIVRSKHTSYTLPAFPAAALLVAWMLDSFISGKGERLIEQIAKWAVAVMLGAAAVIIALASVVVVFDKVAVFTKNAKVLAMVGDLVKSHAASAGVIGAAMVLVGLMGTVLALKRRWGGAITALVIVGAAGVVFTYFVFNPIEDPFRSPKDFAATVNKLAGSAEVAMYGDLPQSITFYCHRKYHLIANPEELRAYLAAGGPGPKYCVMPAANLGDLKKSADAPAAAVSVYKDMVCGDELVLVRGGGP